MFDFWIGEWDVLNRFRQEDGSDREVRAQARIRPAVGGKVIVEHWQSRSERWRMRGFSARSYDPERDLWHIVLNWPGGGPTSFSVMEGRFRHGRGEFFPPARPDGTRAGNTRFTFCDAGPSTLRWDMANPTDDGTAWRTSWIMEWSRAR